MSLSKFVCMKCQGFWTHKQNLPWHQENTWCPKVDDEISVSEKPPKECPFVLDHIMEAQTDAQ